MTAAVSFTLNGKPAHVHTAPDRMLLWVLRSEVGLTSAKYGCGDGSCGACTVLVDGVATRSCRTPLRDVAGRELLTLEGLARERRLRPLRDALREERAFQCGFCRSGMVLKAWALLKRNPSPTHAQIVRTMGGNVCLCGSRERIVKAVEKAAGC